MTSTDRAGPLRRLAVDGQTDLHAEISVFIDESPGPVDRVDHPDAPAGSADLDDVVFFLGVLYDFWTLNAQVSERNGPQRL